MQKKRGALIKIGQKKLLKSKEINPNILKNKIAIYKPINIPNPPNLTILTLCCFLFSGLSTKSNLKLKVLITGIRIIVEKKAIIKPLKLFAA